ncbi:MAG TPA: PAS domain S-box protein [Polyangiaceae bacterium]|nr:PAS domain S-box protein [Polyangiaceae bacterium]
MSASEISLSAREQPSESSLRLLVEQITDYAIFALDVAGQVATWNAGAQRIKGYTASEIIGRHFSQFYRPEDRWKCAVELEAARRDGHVEDEGWRVRKDGSLFWADVVITCLRAADGTIIGYGKVTRDLSERKEAQERLRQADERFRLLVQSVEDYAIFLLDARGHVASWNVGAERIKGYRAEEILGQHFSRFYPPEDVAAGKCELELRVAAEQGRIEDEGFRVRKDGTRFWANVVITALRNPAGELVGFAKVTRDLTERRAAEAARLELGQIARDRLKALGDLSDALTFASSVEDVARVISTRGAELARADTCTLHLLNDETQALDLIAEQGCQREVRERIRYIAPNFADPAYAVGVGRQSSLWVENEAEYRRLYPELAAAEGPEPRVQAFGAVPLVAENKTIGLVGVGFHAARQFSEDERTFASTFARQCAQAIARARRMAAEREAAALAEHLQASLLTTLHSIGDALIATDATGKITLMNAVAEKLTGWTEAEARDEPLPSVFKIVNQHTRAVVEDPVTKVLATGGIVGLANHTILLARDGREVPIDDSGAPIRARDGEIEGVVLVFRDVTARKREEARRTFLADASSALASSLDYERTVSEVAKLSVPVFADWCAVDLLPDGEELPVRIAVAHVDPAKAELARQLSLRYSPHENEQSGVLSVLRTGKSQLFSEITDEMLAARARDSEHLTIAQQLQLRSAMIVPLTVRNRVLGALSFVYAESERRYSAEDVEYAEQLAARCAAAIDNALLFSSEQRSRQAAEVANRTKDEFLAVVSHELRTPLNAIMGWAKLLAAGDLDEQRQRGAIETVERNAVAMAQLIEDLLDMSRIVSGKMRLEIQAVDLEQVLLAALDTVRPAATAKGVELESALDHEVAAFSGDPTRIQQIVWNLLSNAVKFTPRRGKVNLRLRRIDSAMEISVSDTGKGISPSFLPHVFEAFRQEDASSKRTRGGLGLGLAITRQLVELHGGLIRAESAGDGQGSIFTVTLPIAAVAGQGAPESASQRAKASFERPEHLRGLQVLVIDDESDARKLVSAVLEHCGSVVRTAESVFSALTQLRQRVPDIVIADVGMPGEDGYDFIRQLRTWPRAEGGDIPVLALTAYASAEDRRRLLNAGFSMHVPKPVEPAELVAVVGTLCRFARRQPLA